MFHFHGIKSEIRVHTQIFDLRLYRPLRKLRGDLITFFGILPSHQSIENRLKISDLKTIKNQVSNYSGYYCYDEQYIKIDGEKRYRLTLFDSLLNIPLSEEIVEDMEYDTIYTFLRERLRDKPLFTITTDHKREYKKMMDDLKVRHQLCIFHLFKMIGKDEYITMERLELLLNKYDDIPLFLQGYIQKKILPDLERITPLMRDLSISRTTNPVENYYRQTDPGQIKKRYKTSRGILSYLTGKMEYWAGKLGRTQHLTS